ncbi:MAG: hypothetical protein JO360_18635 [Acidobacteria bacterium]|nr:hypothetical protein [Acidobacteriota bacterium]
MSATGVNLKERKRGRRGTLNRETFIQFVLHVSDDRLGRSSVSGVNLLTEDWGLRMVETTCKEQFIETGTKMEEVPYRLHTAH